MSASMSGLPESGHRYPTVQSRDCSHSPIGRYRISALFSVRLHARELDHLAPLLCLGCHIGAELRGAEHYWRHDQFGKTRLDCRVCDPGIDLTAELLNDRGAACPLGLRAQSKRAPRSPERSPQRSARQVALPDEWWWLRLGHATRPIGCAEATTTSRRSRPAPAHRAGR